MSTEDTIFADALAMTSAQDRRDFLDKSCGGDAGLRARMEALLAAHDRAGSFLESPPVGLAALADGAPIAPVERPGAMVGPYKLLEQIGEGGMGVVFMAEQVHPVRRRVALKIIKPGMDTKQVIARFEAERQALAMMDHPNIAKVLEAGATDAGRPYFVMELVRGVPITEYCDQQKLPPRQRLELFVQVCHAVQHAHQKGIIHRDLKPTNVLVTLADDGNPVPKIIDFGVAKATIGQPLTAHTLFTELRQLIGTPLYMSPEQAEMSRLQDVDTRSDVYSLGVLLYELLTGTTPFDRQRLGKAAYDEVRRIIREEEPPRPSTRISTLGETLTTVSAQRQIDPRKLSTILRGELDWIVMRSLEKDRGRRYSTAAGFAQDVERYLSDQPVEACPPSRLYRLHKFARRNKTALSVIGSIAAVLLVATALSTWQAVRATSEKRRADEQAAIAQAINEFLNNDVLGQANPNIQVTPLTPPDRDLKVRDALDRAEARVALRFRGQPLIEAAIRQTIGEAYLGLEEYQKAERQFNEALRLRRERLGDKNPDTLKSMSFLGSVYCKQGRLDEAEKVFQFVLNVRRTVFGENHTSTVGASANLAKLYLYRGNYAKAETLCLQALNSNRKAHLGEDDNWGFATEILGNAYFGEGRYAEAEPLMVALLDRDQKLRGPQHPTTLIHTFNLAKLYDDQNRLAEAEPLCLAAMEGSRRVYGRSHIKALQMQTLLAIIAYHRGRPADAKRLLLEPADALRKLQARRAPDADWLAHDLWLAYVRTDQYDKAEPLALAAVDQYRRRLGTRDPNTLVSMVDLAKVYIRQGRFAEAEPLCQTALEGLRPSSEAHHLQALFAQTVLATIVFNRGRHDDAARLLVEPAEELRRLQSRHDPSADELALDLCFAYLNTEQYEKAEPLLIAIVDQYRRRPGPRDPETLSYIAALGRAYRANYKDDKAESLLLEALKGLKDYPDHRDDYVTTQCNLGRLYFSQGRYADAEPLLRDAVNGLSEMRGARNRQALLSAGELGVTYSLLGDLAKGEPLVLKAIAELSQEFGEQDPDTLETKHNLAATYFAKDLFWKAEPIAMQVLEATRHSLGDDDSRTVDELQFLAEIYVRESKTAAAEQLLTNWFHGRQKSHGNQHPGTLLAADVLAGFYVGQRRWSDAEPLCREMVGSLNKTAPDVTKVLRNSQVDLGKVLDALGRWYEDQNAWSKAELWYKELLAVREKMAGKESAEAGATLVRLGNALRAQRRNDEARTCYDRAIALLRKLDDKLHLADALQQLGHISSAQEAERLFREAFEIRDKGGFRDVGYSIMAMGHLLRSQGRYGEAEAYYRRGMDLQEHGPIWGLPDRLVLKSLLGETISLQGKHQEAEPLLLAAYDELPATRTSDRRDAVKRIVALYSDWGKPDLAERWQLKELEAEIALLTSAIALEAETSGRLPDLLRNRAELYTRLGKPKEADADADRLTRLADAGMSAAVRSRAAMYKRLGRFDEALADYTRLLKLDPSDRDSWTDAIALHLYLGHDEQYLDERKVVLRRLREAKGDDPLNKYLFASSGDHPLRICLLAGPPLDRQDLKLTMAIADRLIGPKQSGNLSWYHLDKALAEYRSGNYQKAIVWLDLARGEFSKSISGWTREERERSIFDDGRTSCDFILAMCEHQLGHEQRAREAMARAQEQLRTYTPSKSSGSSTVGMFDWLMVQIIAREAERTIRVKDPTIMPASGPSTIPLHLFPPPDPTDGT